MGQVIIEVPQDVNRSYRVDDSEFSERLLQNLEDFEQKAKSKNSASIVAPRRNNLKEDGDKVLGIWADREESAEEIARKIREQNRRIT
jgi:chlorite dismutase